MDATSTHPVTAINPAELSPLLGRIDKVEQMMKKYWNENPDLYRIVQLEKQQAAEKKQRQEEQQKVALNNNDNSHGTQTLTTVEAKRDDESASLFAQPLRGPVLRARIRESQEKIRQKVLALDADVIPRTQAQNRKSSYQSIEEEQAARADVVEAQIKAWRSMLPTLIKRFSKIPDDRRPETIKHKVTTLMVFGLFAFVFRLSSRREMNRELTGPVIFEHLKKLFPEIDSIPHADTLTRLLEKTNPKDIEAIHIGLIKELIKKKKFRSLLIHDCLPITIDGTQKLYRNGLLQDALWCERRVGKPEDNNKQQYIYAIEANITLKNGLTIPLMSEYLYRETNHDLHEDDKQDSETTAFERLAERLKDHFPRLKLIFFMDALYATQDVMEILHNYHWDYIIRLPKRKLTDFAKYLNHNKSLSQAIPGQAAFRKREQEFYWQNDIPYGYEGQLTLHLVACAEKYEEVDKKTGKIIECFSEHAWISSIPISIDKVHELLNLGARRKELIEDSMNTEKNRGYHYKHAFSYNWNAMLGFHYLMRLAHAINAICEFTKKLKKYIKENGVSATLKLIKETLFSPWLPTKWYEEQSKKVAHLKLQLE